MKRERIEPPIKVRVVGTPAQIDACYDRVVELLMRWEEEETGEAEDTDDGTRASGRD